MPDIAVIIPTHNRAPLIGEALDSVIAQTIDRQIEVAVVDDGSTDNTREVMQPYLDAHGDPQGKVHINYTFLDKQGVVVARNTAIENTTAPYVAFLDSDDYWAPDKLEKQIGVMEANDALGVSHTSYRYVNDQSEYVDDGPQRVNNPCHGDCVDALLSEDLVIFSSAVIRRSVIDQVAQAEEHGKPFDSRWTNGQDYDLLLRCARVTKFHYVAEPLTYYRMHGGHAAMGNMKRVFGFHCRVQMDFAKRWGEAMGIDESVGRQKAADFLYKRADSFFWQRKLDTARDLCDLAAELGFDDDRFGELRSKASRPAWLYHVKDRIDGWIGRR